MSIVINVGNSKKSNNKERKITSLDTNQDEDENIRIHTDKSTINLPKYISANSNDLNKISSPKKELNSNLDDKSGGTSQSNSNNVKKTTKNTSNENSYSIKFNINSSFISTSSHKKIHSSVKETNPNEISYFYNQKTIGNFNDKNFYDMMNKIEVEKNMDHMENLNNLSNILKNKSIINYHKIMNKNSENEFVYKNFVKNGNYSENKNNENYTNRPKNGLNRGFILEENTGTLSQGSIRSSDGKISDSRFDSGINKQKEEVRVYKLTQKMENIKTNYNTLTTGTNKQYVTASKNSVSYTSNNSIKEDKYGVELTCMQKLCGGKK